MRNVERLENFWHNFVLAVVPLARDVNGAVVACYPEVPMYPFNHAADIKVDKDKVEDLLNRVTQYFLSRRFPYVCFRVSPLTRPRSFTSFLENRGFEKKSEESVMVFKGKHKDKLNPEIKVEEISEREIDTYNNLLIKIFEMPIEWKEGLDRATPEWMRKGIRFYLAYLEGKPVGTCTLGSLMKTGGIFSVGTLKKYRRRGIGTSLTVHAIIESIRAGNDLHTLQTAKGGYAEQLYKKIGFVIDHSVSWFVKSFKGD